MKESCLATGKKDGVAKGVERHSSIVMRYFNFGLKLFSPKVVFPYNQEM
jgi:hypothetical protein